MVTPPTTTNPQVSEAKAAAAGPIKIAPALQEGRTEERANPVLQTTGGPPNLPNEMGANAGHPPASSAAPKPVAAVDIPNFMAQRQLCKPEPAPQPSQSSIPGTTRARSTVAPEPLPPTPTFQTRPAEWQGPALTAKKPAAPPSAAVAKSEPVATEPPATTAPTIDKLNVPADAASPRPQPVPQRPAEPTPKPMPAAERQNIQANAAPPRPQPAAQRPAEPTLKPMPAAERQNIQANAAPPRPQPAAQRPAEPALKPMPAAERQNIQANAAPPRPQPVPQRPAEPQAKVAPDEPAKPSVTEMKDAAKSPGMITIEGDTGPIKTQQGGSPPGGVDDKGRRGGGGGGGGGAFHKRLGPVDFGASLRAGLSAVRKNLLIVMLFTVACNILVLAIPIYLFQISDRVLTSRSPDTLVMLTVVIVGAVMLQAMFDALRRFILMRTAVEMAAQLGAPILSAAARASLHSNGKEYQVLGDLQQLRTFLTSGTLLSFLDAPMAPLMVLVVFLIHPHQGFIVMTSAVLLLIITLLNQRATAATFGEANAHQSKANIHLDSMSRNSQIINALAMIPEAVKIWGKDTANSLRAQVIAQDRNIVFASMSKAVRLLTQVTMLGWGAHLAIEGHLTGGMVIAASIIAGRALGPIEGAIEGWNHVVHARAAYGRIASLLQSSPLNFERLNLPRPEGRLDVERLLFVPQGTKRVVLNGISFALSPGDSLAIIGNSGAGKTTLGKMLVGSILPTSGNVRLDLMDLRNWDPRQFGENIGYLPQDVQLFPASIKANIARMRDDATDAEIYQAAALADVHEMISTLPHGYETFVAADGAPLSGGQKQRVALARAFFGNPRLVVLDEPNSNLDSAGDAALERALQHAKENKITVITITQRPSLLKSVDKILLLVNGTVALFGMRQEVLQALANRGLSIEGGSFGHQIQ
ncbi:protease/lipase ABC transporter permease/ATP-binding protein [Mesorhizobium sp. WSM3873]|nr:protease/lipase ABC transporter permease/ATP-binding protein [Mesorhizobium sp. WSM3873]